MPICASRRPITTKKYLRVAFIDGVATALNSGSAPGAGGSEGSVRAVLYPIIAAMPAISRMIEAIDHNALPVVNTFPTSGSCGQLLVYDKPVSPGRSVAAAQEDQKKNAVSAARCSTSGSALSVIAYC